MKNNMRNNYNETQWLKQKNDIVYKRDKIVRYWITKKANIYQKRNVIRECCDWI